MEEMDISCNNNSERGFSPKFGVKSSSTYPADVFEDITPEDTSEGYGLRTPYGTHLSLDFLKYCRELGNRLSTANNEKPKEAKSGGTSQASSHLMETRRRIDEFRSFRVKHRNSTDNLFTSNETKPHLPGNDTNDESALDIQEGKHDADVFKWMNSPISHHNLQIVREQMVKALTRLRHLEEEVKQVPILQIKLSVLQQEKQNLRTALKLTKKGLNDELSAMAKVSADFEFNMLSNVDHHKTEAEAQLQKTLSNVIRPSNDVSVDLLCASKSVLTRDVEFRHASTTTHDMVECNDCACKRKEKPSYRDVACDPVEMPPICDTGDLELCFVNDARRGMPQEHVLPSVPGFINIGDTTVHSTVDPKASLQKQFHDCSTEIDFVESAPEYIDIAIGDSRSCLYVDASTSCSQITQSVKEEVSTKEVFTNTEVLPKAHAAVQHTNQSHDVYVVANITPAVKHISTSTHEKGFIKGMFTSTGALPKVDAATQHSIPLCDEHVVPKTAPCVRHVSTSTDIKGVGMKETCDAYVVANIAPLVKHVSTSTGNNDVSTKEVFMNTDTIPKVHAAVQHSNLSCDVYVAANITPIVKQVSTITDFIELTREERSMNTERVRCFEKSCNSRVEVAEFTCQVSIPEYANLAMPGICPEKTDKNVDTTFDTVVVKGTYGSTPPCSSMHLTVFPGMAEAAIVTDTSEPEAKELESKRSPETHEAISCDGSGEQIHSVDAMTDTNDLFQETAQLNMLKNEIGEYVGQVEILLEEQQSLLTDKYKELEGVLDENESEALKGSEDTVEPLHAAEVTLDESVEGMQGSTKVYALSHTLQSTCIDMCNYLVDASLNYAPVPEQSMMLLQQEWFSLAAHLESVQGSIAGFVAEVGRMSPVLLSKVVNSMDSSGNTAIHYAVSHRNFSVIEQLVSIRELDVDLFNYAGYTASMLASITRISSKAEEEAAGLLFARANIDLHAKQAGETALMLAVSHDCCATAKLLLKAGADINARDKDGSTSLMYAAEHRHAELVKLLLSHPQCDPTLVDNDGSTVMDIAVETGQRNIVILLYTTLDSYKPLALLR